MTKVVRAAAGAGSSRPQKFAVDKGAFKLDIALDPPVGIGESATVAIDYSCKPRAGLYFYPQEGNKLARRPGTTARAGSTGAGSRPTTIRTTGSRSSSS